MGTGGFTFAGGILKANNRSDSTIGALTLTADSTLALTSDSTHGSLSFDSAAWTSGTLLITGWTGSPGGAGTDDRIYITGSVGSGFLSHVNFDIGGTLFFGSMSGTELVPSLTAVPEPIEWALIIFGSLAALGKFVLPRLYVSRLGAGMLNWVQRDP